MRAKESLGVEDGRKPWCVVEPVDLRCLHLWKCTHTQERVFWMMLRPSRMLYKVQEQPPTYLAVSASVRVCAPMRVHVHVHAFLTAYIHMVGAGSCMTVHFHVMLALT